MKPAEEFKDATEIAIEKQYFQQFFDNAERQIVHNPYTHELRQCAAIERGDVKDLEHILTEDFSTFEGRFCEDPIRQEIYMGIVNITIASRAAIRGGVHYEKAFTLSDACIQLMSECKDPQEIRKIYRTAQFKYARLVRKAQAPMENNEVSDQQKLAANPHIRRCKDYISAHITQKITIQDIADNIGVTPNYLSAIFRKYEHISLKDYITKEKIDMIQLLLMYSPYSYVDISLRLGYSSQSHMGAEFKKHTGMTPRKFRETYQKEDFIEFDSEN